MIPLLVGTCGFPWMLPSTGGWKRFLGREVVRRHYPKYCTCNSFQISISHFDMTTFMSHHNCELLDLCIGQWLSWNGQGVGAALEELVGPDAELWELGVVVTEPGAVPRTGSWSSWGTAWIKWNVHRPIRYFSIVQLTLTLCKANKALKMDEKRWLKDCFPSGKVYFQGYVGFREGISVL